MNFTRIRRASSGNSALISTIPVNVLLESGFKEGDTILWSYSRKFDKVIVERVVDDEKETKREAGL